MLVRFPAWLKKESTGNLTREPDLVSVFPGHSGLDNVDKLPNFQMFITILTNHWRFTHSTTKSSLSRSAGMGYTTTGYIWEFLSAERQVVAGTGDRLLMAPAAWSGVETGLTCKRKCSCQCQVDLPLALQSLWICMLNNRAV